MKKGKFSIISSSGKIIVATVKFEDGEVWDICNKGYDLNQSYNNKICWVEENQIYLDEYRDRKLKQKISQKRVKSQSHQQTQDSQQKNEMSIQDCVTKQTVRLKTCLPKDTREALADSNNAFDNFSLKLNKAARFDCRVKIEDYKNMLCKPSITDDLRYIVSYEDEEGSNIVTSGNAKYLSISRPLTDHEKNVWLELNPEVLGNTDDAAKKIAIKKRSVIKKLFEQSKYAERKFRFCETDKDGFLYQPASFFGSLDFGKIAERHRRSIEALNLSISSYDGQIDWRLIVGLGNESVYDTSITLHHVYGIPYIPASAVKGIVRSWIITERFGRDEKEAIVDNSFCDVFGCPKKTEGINSHYNEDRQGRVWFFDAFLLSRPKIEVDIMNPHYMPYYSGDEPPADYHDPKQIPFLTIKSGTVFQFHYGIKEKDDEEIRRGKFSGSKPSVIVKEWLKKALEQHGIGAKTAVGYGYMKDFQTGGVS